MCLAQGHNAVTPMRLEPLAPRSRVKHSTTEPLRPITEISLSGKPLLYQHIWNQLSPTFDYA